MATTQEKHSILYIANTIYVLSDQLQAYLWNSDNNTAEINFTEPLVIIL